MPLLLGIDIDRARGLAVLCVEEEKGQVLYSFLKKNFLKEGNRFRLPKAYVAKKKKVVRQGVESRHSL